MRRGRLRRVELAGLDVPPESRRGNVKGGAEPFGGTEQRDQLRALLEAA